MIRRALAIAALSGALGCATTPRLPVLEDLDRARQTPKVEAAERLAPQAYLHAEDLRRQALQAADEGDRATAQILAEHALAAYEHAFVLARLAKADTRLEQASRQLSGAQKELQALDAQQTAVAAEANDLEMRLKVHRDALPISPVEPASASREQARLDAARSLGLQARLLCVSASLIAKEPERLGETQKALDALEKTIADRPKQAPIAEATRLRAACLRFITEARRPAMHEAPEVSQGDELLDKLSRAGFEPHRDDRGVVVVMASPFSGPGLRPDAQKRIEALGQVARELGSTPVLVVAHRARGDATEQDRQRVERASAILEGAGATNVTGRSAGDARPILPGKSRQARVRNERLEIVFVTRSW